MTTRVLFVCPHAAGKSLMAATYFRAAAARRGLDVAVDLAGPEPDPHNMENVEAALTAQGFSIGFSPRLIQASDVDLADAVVSVGCPAEQIPSTGPSQSWDVPQLSEDFAGSMQQIYASAESLAADMASALQPDPSA